MINLVKYALGVAAAVALLTAPFSADAQRAACCGCGGYCHVGAQQYTCDYECSGGGCNFTITHEDCDDNSCDDGKCVKCIKAEANVKGTSGEDVICVKDGVGLGYGEGNDTATGLGGDDIIATGDGNDDIDGGTYHDLIYAGNGNDTVDAGSGNDTTYGGAGDDDLVTGGGVDRIYGEDDNDTIDGSGSNDTLSGGAGNDIIDGKGGNDDIAGGTGRNVLYGGAGNDTLTTDLAGSPETFGSILCGGPNDDTLVGAGYGHVCLDGGTGQVAGGCDCTYSGPGAPAHCDAGTVINCASPCGSISATGVTCGCP